MDLGITRFRCCSIDATILSDASSGDSLEIPDAKFQTSTVDRVPVRQESFRALRVPAPCAGFVRDGPGMEPTRAQPHALRWAANPTPNSPHACRIASPRRLPPKRGARNGARHATKGARGCNSPVRPNQPSRLGDTDTGGARKCASNPVHRRKRETALGILGDWITRPHTKAVMAREIASALGEKSHQRGTSGNRGSLHSSIVSMHPSKGAMRSNGEPFPASGW